MTQARTPLALVLLLLLAACGTAPLTADWQSSVILRADAGLGGCAIGDVSQKWPGNEIVATATDGKVWVMGSTDGVYWDAVVAVTLPGEMIQVTTGDVRPDIPGDEIIAVGMLRGAEDETAPGAAYAVWNEAGAWRHQKIADDARLLHGVCVADADPNAAGNEVWVAGFSNRVREVVYEGGAWRELGSARISGPGKCATPFQGGVAVGGSDGAIHLCRPVGGELAAKLLLEGDTGVARIGADGDALLFCCDDGTLHFFRDGRQDTIHREELKLRGAVLADLDPELPGREAVTVGYAKRLTVLASNGDESRWLPVHTELDTDALHHATSGELDGDPTTREIVVVGFSGNVTLLRLP